MLGSDQARSDRAFFHSGWAEKGTQGETSDQNTVYLTGTLPQILNEHPFTHRTYCAFCGDSHPLICSFFTRPGIITPSKQSLGPQDTELSLGVSNNVLLMQS